jgi:hypothetical protein
LHHFFFFEKINFSQNYAFCFYIFSGFDLVE